ncbi:MAG: hypothetical protein Q4F67_04220 [Propionibacteriaceae bacterium]|nr:hypothetical protein [Propionibacteriaceae bacterium]
MLADVVDLLRCPHCADPLVLDGRTAGCARGHRFDVARQGQLNLLRRPAGATADTAAMVAARAEFLSRGHYAPIAELVVAAAADALPGDPRPDGPVAVEPGAGTGYYLATVLDRLLETAPVARGIASDLSAYACRRAAKLPRTGAIVADTWAGLPIRDAVADIVLTVFAPRNWSEFARICAPSGRVLVVTPLPDHLREVRLARGLMAIEKAKHERLLAEAEPWLRHAGHEGLRYRRTFTTDEITALVAMGPNAFHADAGAPTAKTEPLETTIAVRLDAFEPNQRCV